MTKALNLCQRFATNELEYVGNNSPPLLESCSIVREQRPTIFFKGYDCVL